MTVTRFTQAFSSSRVAACYFLYNTTVSVQVSKHAIQVNNESEIVDKNDVGYLAKS
jgi:hypothetical protein